MRLLSRLALRYLATIMCDERVPLSHHNNTSNNAEMTQKSQLKTSFSEHAHKIIHIHRTIIQ